MATICKQPNGRRKVQVMVPTGQRDARGRPVKARRSVSLGKMSQEKAERYAEHIDHLAACKASGQPIPPATADWLGTLGDEHHARLAAAGLIESRAAVATASLGPFLEDYVEKRVDVKPGTRTFWRHTSRNLRAFFGAGRELASITEGDAEDFKQFLVAEKLAAATISRRLGLARQFFAMAVKRRIVDRNPFAEVKRRSCAGEGRRFFVARETIDRVSAVCNPTWRLILSLARYGGLRCPSEVLSLKWEGVNWSTCRILVESPKTAHHPGKASRVIPLFPELRSDLTKAWEAAAPGEVYVVDAPQYRAAAQGRDGWRNANLRTQFHRLLARAGVATWPRVFQNLRASRETELAADHPIHVVTAWMGNTPTVAQKHYLQVRDSDFERASNPGAELGAARVQNQVQPHQDRVCQTSTSQT